MKNGMTLKSLFYSKNEVHEIADEVVGIMTRVDWYNMPTEKGNSKLCINLKEVAGFIVSE